MRIYTKTGDDGTTGLLFGGRIAEEFTGHLGHRRGGRSSSGPGVGSGRGAIGLGPRRHAHRAGEDLYVLMAELTTAPANRRKLRPGVSLVTADMVSALEAQIDELIELFPPITDFVIPGHDRVSALLDVARTVTRRAERLALDAAPKGSSVVAYLNRLSDLIWAMARCQEHGDSLLSRHGRPTHPGGAASPDPGRDAAEETTT